MPAYLRIEGLDPEDLDDADPELFNDLANGVFAHLRDEAPALYEHHEGVIPVRQPEHDPRLLDTTAVYAHRDASVDDGPADHVHCSFEGDVNGLDDPAAHSGGPQTFAEIELTRQFDDEKGRLDHDAWRAFVESLPSETEREEAGDPPVRVGTLYHDGDQVVRVEFDEDVFDEVSDE
ncbi:hypothetical protein [Halorussus halobius]|uniref:hypothetical protein n=1 Tax=Halorussus halobius TaxID=1710537 RepID=UPI001091C7E6|nr:hypothetical protein [Halorussus halobius]